MAKKISKTELELRARIAELEKLHGKAVPIETTGIPVDDSRPLKLDLACGQTPKEGYTGVDKFCGDERVDLLVFPWPFEDNSVDALYCSHFIEHIAMNDLTNGGTDLLIAFFNEAFRVAKPGASFELVWPALQSVRAFQDPTHRRFIPLQTMLYLSAKMREENKLGHYLGATCNWEILNGAPTIAQEDSIRSDAWQQEQFRFAWNFQQDLFCTLKAVK